MANLAEGFEDFHPAEQLRFYGYARRSCAEVRSDLYVGLDDEYFSKGQFNELMAQCVLTGRLLTGLIRNVRSYMKRNAASS